MPDIIADLRTALYGRLAPLANRWNESMGIDVRYPDAHADFVERCHKAGQTRPTLLLLQYGAGDYNCLHQDLYGEHVFPFQVAFLLAEPGKDFTGGEFVLTEQRPRMQSRAEVVPLRPGSVDRAQPLKRLDQAWEGFKQSYADLPDAQLLEPGVTGAWSIKDIIAHVTWWEEEALTHLPLILTGGRPPRYSVTYGGIDAFNAMMTERRKDWPLAEVLRQRDDVHCRLIAFIESAPDDQTTGDTRFRRRLRLDTYGHYPKHARAIRTWREQRSTLRA